MTDQNQIVPNTLDPPVIDRKDWAALQELIAEVQQTERLARKYATSIHLWDAAVRLFRSIEQRQFITVSKGSLMHPTLGQTFSIASVILDRFKRSRSSAR
jgi:hypothetical protein